MAAREADRGANGDGWVHCAQGHRHWGRFGAAGLLVTAEERLLLAHRAFWSHHGGTWGIPGGARDGAETAHDAALREAAEETGLDAAVVVVRGETVDDHGGWSYTTVHAGLTVPPPALEPTDGEATELRWVPLGEVDDLDLHPGFAGFWRGPHAPAH
ncbi:NUDIX hydrolase [Actinomycetospora sp.]|uniref:NUDIX hydrolase n=1 Tax=Actinomycetospora sp. TaxID=1872135 RepID=UPI002F41D899